ncbi:unnamed protein product [Prorocentrum cordatum]|uniref:Uncharacterized protein n=1 Tax=Prorocentrum cordatum TaxID=2364126 RepID=A0ABN9SU62_9DINO|nr:unnamed protein product [Polarella glacialis]
MPMEKPADASAGARPCTSTRCGASSPPRRTRRAATRTRASSSPGHGARPPPRRGSRLARRPPPRRRLVDEATDVGTGLCVGVCVGPALDKGGLLYCSPINSVTPHWPRFLSRPPLLRPPLDFLFFFVLEAGPPHSATE